MTSDGRTCCCGFWPSLLGATHQWAACILLIERETKAIREECCESACRPGCRFPVFAACIEEHTGSDGFLHFSESELAPYKDEEEGLLG